MSVDDQPISTVEWVDPDTLRANGYNPNHVAPPEMRLLKLSIMENGWTQPIVAHPDGEIIDGFHRWTLALKDSAVRSLTGGLAPVVRVQDAGDEMSRLATIRHNRARGNHFVGQMAEIVNELVAGGMSTAEVEKRLGMDKEEVRRLIDRGDSLKRNAADDFGTGWVPAP